MKSRCKNAKCHSYGAMGIKYDRHWESFDAFLSDMGERPVGKTLDRIDVMGHYCKANCRWASPLIQANNKRATELLYYNWEHNGPVGSVAEWARFLRKKTGSQLWTVRRLQAVLKLLTLDQIIGAFHPQRLTPEELNEKEREALKTAEQRRVDQIFNDMLSGYIDVV
jgi:hypothetical protein